MKFSHLENLLKKWDVEYTRNFKLSSASYIGIGGVSEVYTLPKSISELVNLLSYLHLSGIKYKLTGRMSNLLFASDIFRGVIINTSKINAYSRVGNVITADCGVRVSTLIRDLAESSLGGLESLYGIPGSLGGMVYSNAGAYGSSISNFIKKAKIFDLRRQMIYDIFPDELGFSYRESNLSREPIILLNADIEFIPLEKSYIKAKLNEVIERRYQSQPYDKRSLGSIFKREGEIPISRLIDLLGLKGLRVGDAAVSTKHAGFIVNNGSAKSDDVLELIKKISEKINENYGFKPRLEIEVVY